MIKLINEKFPWLIQFLKFGSIGAFNTLLNIGIYDLLVFFNMNPQLSYFIGFIITVLNAYFWNYVWVFKDKVTNKGSNKLAIVKFFALYGATYLLGAGLLYVWIDVLHISKFIAPMISLLITIPTNFLASKFWVFRSKN